MNDELVAQFVDTTQTDANTAQQFLEHHNWDIDSALAAFYAEDSTPETAAGASVFDQASATTGTSAPPPALKSSGNTVYTASGVPVKDDAPSGWTSKKKSESSRQPLRTTNGSRIGGFGSLSSGSSGSQQRASTHNRNTGSGPRVATFRDLNRSSDNADEKQPAEFYTGGGRSGLNVEDNKNKDDDPNSSSSHAFRLIESMIKRQQENNDESETSHEATPNTSQNRRKFKGKGHTLTGETLTDEDETSSAQNDNADEDEQVTRTMIFWKDGISVEDGPLIRYDDPKNKVVLDAIDRGYAPLDVLNVKPNQLVSVNVERRFDDEYKPPPPGPFSGTGNRLGSDAPVISETPATETQGNQPATPGGSTISAPVVDEALPVTTIQVRLRDGRRLVVRLNNNATVGDLRQYVASQGVPNVSLQLAFPPKPLTDDSATLEAAGLLNSAVIQR